MSFRGLFSAFIFVIIAISAVIIFDNTFHFPLSIVKKGIFFTGSIIITLIILLSKNLKVIRTPAIDELTGKIKKPILHHGGIVLMIIGGIIAMGNVTGSFTTFPYAGSGCIGFGLIINLMAKNFKL